MNPVLILTHNNLEFTKRCVESVKAQDIPTNIFVYDNGSTDGSVEWLKEERVLGIQMPQNTGVSHGWNAGLYYFFEWGVTHSSHVLVLNNDTMIPPHFYSLLLGFDVPFVTGISCDDPSCVTGTQQSLFGLGDGPDFSAFLIRRSAWETVGPFDEKMKFYASDNDWHVRAHRAGIRLWNSGVPFYHERSSTLNNATPFERRAIQLQADHDRAVFRSKWGCYPESPEVAALFSEVAK